MTRNRIADSIKGVLAANRAESAAYRAPREAKPEPWAPIVRKPYTPRVKPPKPVDSLRYLWRDRPEAFLSVGLASSTRDHVTDMLAVEPDGGRAAERATSGVKAIYKPGMKSPQGAGEMIARLGAKGITFRLAHDPAYFIVETPGGGMDDPMRTLIRAAAPMLLAFLQGQPLVCLVSDHGRGRWAEAVTLLVGGCPACAECAGRA